MCTIYTYCVCLDHFPPENNNGERLIGAVVPPLLYTFGISSISLIRESLHTLLFEFSRRKEKQGNILYILRTRKNTKYCKINREELDRNR